MRDPRTPDEWREAVAWAYGLLLLDSAVQYGLVTGGPRPNLERCRAILERGAALGIVLTRDEEDAAIAAIVAAP